MSERRRLWLKGVRVGGPQLLLIGPKSGSLACWPRDAMAARAAPGLGSESRSSTGRKKGLRRRERRGEGRRVGPENKTGPVGGFGPRAEREKGADWAELAVWAERRKRGREKRKVFFFLQKTSNKFNLNPNSKNSNSN